LVQAALGITFIVWGVNASVPGWAGRHFRVCAGHGLSNALPWHTTRSSRIYPANDRETSRNDGNGWSIESAGQEPDSGIAAGSENRLRESLTFCQLLQNQGSCANVMAGRFASASAWRERGVVVESDRLHILPRSHHLHARVRPRTSEIVSLSSEGGP
jgi:hypothetical protein